MCLLTRCTLRAGRLSSLKSLAIVGRSVIGESKQECEASIPVPAASINQVVNFRFRSWPMDEGEFVCVTAYVSIAYI